MKRIYLLFLCFSVLMSCQQEELEFSPKEDNSLETRASLPSAIDQILGMPLNITLPDGVAASSRTYMSAKPKHYSVRLTTKDDGSGRERWIMNRYLHGYSLMALSSHNNNPYIYQSGNNPYMHNGPEKTVLEVTSLENNKFTITAYNKTKYLQGGNFNSWDVLFNGSYPGNRGEWEIIPVENFVLQNIAYSIETDDKTSLLPSFIDEVDVVNGGNTPAEMTINFSRTATESSTFSKTEGLTITTATSFKVGIPILVNGKLDVTQTTNSSWTYATSEQHSDTRSYAFKLSVPAHKTYKAKVIVALYNTSATYVATYKSTSSGRIIKLSGKWSGIKAGKISYEIYDNGSLLKKM